MRSLPGLKSFVSVMVFGCFFWTISPQSRRLLGQPPPSNRITLKANDLVLLNVKAEDVQFHGRHATHIFPGRGAQTSDGNHMAILKDIDFKNGTIDLQIAGEPVAGAPAEARGFVGIAFRIDSTVSGFEYIYLRPTNGRSNDQVRRNHSTQYASFPDYPFDRLRRESPGMYESYVDIQPGALTEFRLVVNEQKALLFVHGSDQPCLVVNDLKRAVDHGRIGLWIGDWAEGYFSELVVSPAR